MREKEWVSFQVRFVGCYSWPNVRRRSAERAGEKRIPGELGHGAMLSGVRRVNKGGIKLFW